MLHASGDWQEITSSDGAVKTYLGIFTPDGPDDWGVVTDYFTKVKEIIERLNLGSAAHVSLSAGVLTVSFETAASQVLPDTFVRAARELTAVLTSRGA